jgi:hypothetical protein
MGTDRTTTTQADGRCVLGCPVAWLNQAGFLSVWLVWADVVPGDEATLWKNPAVTGRYG